jgi:hypothetical protein
MKERFAWWWAPSGLGVKLVVAGIIMLALQLMVRHSGWVDPLALALDMTLFIFGAVLVAAGCARIVAIDHPLHK